MSLQMSLRRKRKNRDKKKENEIKHFEISVDLLKWNELHKDELKDL